MARRATRRRASTARRSGGSSRGYGVRSTGRGTARAGASRKSARRGSTRRASRGPQTVRIVLEHAGAAPVREGQQVDIGMKVAKAPRLKPRF